MVSVLYDDASDNRKMFGMHDSNAKIVYKIQKFAFKEQQSNFFHL